jgi:hypothetical protein
MAPDKGKFGSHTGRREFVMFIVKQFNSVNELQMLQRLACSTDEEVYIHSMDDSVMVDAKSFINLFTLDFSQPVKIVTESDFVAKEVERWL